MEEPPSHHETQKKFSLPVDSENKATKLNLLSLKSPHMRAFHLSWISFCTCFISTFAAPPLTPVIRDNLNLTSTDISNAGIASVSGTVLSRILLGSSCDILGPRLSSSTLMLLTAPATFLMALVSSPLAFILSRFTMSFSLATFVSTQFWMSSMFSPPLLGTANGLAAGWGNLGGGATQLLMPLLFSSLVSHLSRFTAWRAAFLFPGILQMSMAFVLLIFSQDTPEGGFRRVEKKTGGFGRGFVNGVRNYRGWVTALSYGYCFGVELTVDNVIAEYFYDKFDLRLSSAGVIAASFGMANLVSRPAGGAISDLLGERFGMRGRLWGLWVVQSMGGVLCVVLGFMDSLAASVAVMVVFSFFVQAACGLTFGVVPFISRRSLGLISGMTGAGGSVGAIIKQLIFFRGSRYTREKGIILMGVMIVCCTIPVFFIYFPQWGGMLFPPSRRDNSTEEAYYLAEWSSEEIQNGMHHGSMKFAANSRRERGKKESARGDTPQTQP